MVAKTGFGALSNDIELVYFGYQEMGACGEGILKLLYPFAWLPFDT